MTTDISRRNFLKGSAKAGGAVTLGGSLLYLSACSSGQMIIRPEMNLVKDPAGICDLPEGFSYTVISPYDEVMSDGHRVPGYHDGMGCFAGPNGETILVRNHEIGRYFPFDLDTPEPDMAYDPEAAGGTTTVWLDDQLKVTKHHLSLTGTIRNCSGGTTPWGTWISCEEPSEGFWKTNTWEMGDRHGYAFEVNPLEPLKKIMPLKAMGRFTREAVAVDPVDGVVYQTEDNMNGCFYRFLPAEPGNLAAGGTLQALKFTDTAITHTTKDKLAIGQAYPCEWVSIENPDPDDNTLAHEARAKGAAVFVRGEGIVAHEDGIYFACTAGGPIGQGQFFKYVPDRSGKGGSISLVYETTTRGVLEKPDNITLNEWGDLIICEDNSLNTQCLAGLTPDGRLYYIAATTRSEWAGACFSPDGRTLFANIQKDPGLTVGIRGPWEKLRAKE